MMGSITEYLGRIRPVSGKPSRLAYNIWAKEYDNQPNNLMLKLDEELALYFFPKLNIENKLIIDIGCGTGRHWMKILAHKPAKLSGFDVSIEMLRSLKHKFPEAECFEVQEGSTLPFAESSVDIIISTLTIAHIRNPLQAIREWSRVLCPGGLVYLSDFHPQVLKMGGKRSFNVQGESFVVKNFIHKLSALLHHFGNYDIRLSEKKEIHLDALLRHHYESQNALGVYNKFYGMPLIYGMLLQKIYKVV